MRFRLERRWGGVVLWVWCSGWEIGIGCWQCRWCYLNEAGYAAVACGPLFLGWEV